MQDCFGRFNVLNFANMTMENVETRTTSTVRRLDPADDDYPRKLQLEGRSRGGGGGGSAGGAPCRRARRSLDLVISGPGNYVLSLTRGKWSVAGERSSPKRR